MLGRCVLRLVSLGLVVGLLGASAPAWVERADAGPDDSWVIYTNELNWLRVGPQAEFDKPWQKHQEIWGGRSRDPLKKELVKGGFDSRAKALKVACGQLSKVRLKYHGHATPKWTTNALFKGKEYNLRLSSGDVGAPRRGMEYDLDAEIQVLRSAGGITPRLVFGPLFLCHAIQRSAYGGPQKLDQWVLQPVRPQPHFTDPVERIVNPDKPPTRWHYVVGDGYGGRRSFLTDQFDGPFLDNFTLARALKEHKIDKVKLWPPQRQRDIYADDVPDDARDFGIDTESVQPHVADPRMLEWVVYATEMNWLRIGTKTEFQKPRPRNEEIWAGRSQDPIPKKQVLKQTFHTYEQALRAVCAGMSQVKWRYVHNNRPNWIPLGTVQGKAYHLQLARDPKLLVVSGIGYDSNAERVALAQHGITPKLSFGDQYLVHSVQMSTYSGPQKTNRWMLVQGKPKGNHVAVPDGTGGRFHHTIDKTAGPFKDNYRLAQELRRRKIKSIPLAGSRIRIDPNWVPTTPKDHGEQAKATRPSLTKVVPEKATQGEVLYVTLFGKDLEYGAEIDFGQGIEARKFTYFGRDPKSDDEQWLLTLSIEGDADVGKRDVGVSNYDSGRTIGKALFEVVPAVDPQCPHLDLPVVANNAKAAEAAVRQRKAIQALTSARKGLHDWEIKLLTEEQSARRSGTLQDDGVRIRLALMQNRRVDALQEIEKVSANVRKAEADWIKSLKGIGSGIASGSRRALLQQCSDRAQCLRAEMFKRLKELEAVDRALVLALDPIAGKHYQKYATSRNDLGATLKFMGVMLNVEIEVAQRDRRRARHDGADPAAAQHALYRAQVARAEWALQSIEMKGLTALEAQKHYYYAVAALHAKGEKTPWMKSWLGDAAQAVMSGTNYVLASFGTAWTTFFDGCKHMLPDAMLDATGIKTQAQKIDAQILKARKDFDAKLDYVRGLRTASPEVSRASRVALIDSARTELVSKGYTLLLEDRAFHELTDGGLFRILGAYDTDRTEHLETELLAAIHHGRLSVRDMQRSLNVEMGRVPETGDVSLKGLLDPMRVWRVIKADELGVLAEKRVFIDTKRAQVELEMAQLLPRWRKIRYDFGKVAAFLPKNFQHHSDLLWNSEDYCQFMVRVRMFEHEEVLATLERHVAQSKSVHMKRALESLRQASAARLALELRPYLARAYQLQAQTKIICRDFPGAAAAMEQAFKINPELAETIGSDRVKDALLWEDVRERALDLFHQFGNQGFSAALSAKIMQLIGPASAAAGGPKSFTEFLWGQINPFANVMTAEGAKSVVENLGEQLAGEVVGEALEKRVGIDKAYADWLAGQLVGLASNWGKDLGARGVDRVKQSRFFQSAMALNEASAAIAQKRPDTDPDIAGSRKKSDLEDRIVDLSVVSAAEKSRQDAEAAYRTTAAKSGAESQEATAARERVVTCEADLDGRTRPLAEQAVLGALKTYGAKTKQGFELKHALRLFRRLPLAKLRSLKRAGKLAPGVERQVDAVRLQMMDALQKEVVRRSEGKVVCLVVTGAAADPEGPEYAQKLLDSDVDFTFLTQAGLRDTELAKIEALYAKIVSEGSGRSPMDLADSTGFCDKLHDGYDLETLAAVTQANVGNPERYLNLGSTQFVLFMNRVAGRFKALNKSTGKWETLPLDANEKIFGNQKFETWMGADIALEQYRFREAHREHRGADVVGFLKDQGKYSVRVALGKLLSDPAGCARINALKAKAARDAGGLHAAIIQVAREFEGKLFSRQQLTFLEQCNQLKKGARPEEVFRVSGDGATNDAIRKHNQVANAFFDEALPVAMKSQQETMTGLDTPSASHADQELATKILLAQAWALSRLDPKHRDHLSKLGGTGDFTTSHAALELAQLYRELVPPNRTDRHQHAPPAPKKNP